MNHVLQKLLALNDLQLGNWIRLAVGDTTTKSDFTNGENLRKALESLADTVAKSGLAVPEGYRILKVGEALQKGDLYDTCGQGKQWEPVLFPENKRVESWMTSHCRKVETPPKKNKCDGCDKLNTPECCKVAKPKCCADKSSNCC